MATVTDTSTTYSAEGAINALLGINGARFLADLEDKPEAVRVAALQLLTAKLGIKIENNNGSTTTRNYSDSKSTSSTSSSTPATLNDYVIALYKDHIGKAPTQAIKDDIRDLIASGMNDADQWEYVMQETAAAPFPSWRYARAIIRRVRSDSDWWK